MSYVIFIFLFLLLFATPFSGQNEKVHVCGRPLGVEFKLEEDRIVAGYDIGYYRYPWYAAIMRNGVVICGGALVGPKTVITAAHCYKEFLYLANKGFLKLEGIYTVKLGVYNICTSESTQKEFKIEKVQIHELYSKKKPYYDICLLTLVEDTKGYEPICLPDSEIPKKPQDGTVPGLGMLKYHGVMPCTVHEARLLIYNDSACHKMIASTGNNDHAITNAFCAGYIQGGIDTCQGDSGGPLQVLNNNGDFVLIGVVSFGFKCAEPGLLGMYTDVSEYLDWIQEKTGLDSGIVDLIYNKSSPTPARTTTEKPIKNENQAKRKYHFGRPFRRPIRIVVYRNKKMIRITRSMLHRPIIRDFIN